MSSRLRLLGVVLLSLALVCYCDYVAPVTGEPGRPVAHGGSPHTVKYSGSVRPVLARDWPGMSGVSWVMTWWMDRNDCWCLFSSRLCCDFSHGFLSVYGVGWAVFGGGLVCSLPWSQDPMVRLYDGRVIAGSFCLSQFYRYQLTHVLTGSRLNCDYFWNWSPIGGLLYGGYFSMQEIGSYRTIGVWLLPCVHTGRDYMRGSRLYCDVFDILWAASRSEHYFTFGNSFLPTACGQLIAPSPSRVGHRGLHAYRLTWYDLDHVHYGSRLFVIILSRCSVHTFYSVAVFGIAITGRVSGPRRRWIGWVYSPFLRLVFRKDASTL